MGGSAVQEWTLRVNMFEAMLYAVLQTFQSRGLWTGTVHAVAPGKVATFWLSDSDAEPAPPAPPSRSTTAKTKTAKIDIVAGWLKHHPPFVLAGRTADLGRAYLRKRRGGKKATAEEKDGLGAAVGAAEMGKLDDLADCLLQGMAWIRWEENRRRVLEGGLEALGTPREKGGIAEGAEGVGETVATSKRGTGRRRAKE
ncbi:Ribonuclease H-like domain [Lasallia pustulata]|nr:Ribonuclease H-like domain [Lasallia pustulata]